MTDVYCGVHRATGAPVVVKQLRSIPETLLGYHLKDLRSEIASLLALTGHPNVVQLRDHFVTPVGGQIVLEFVPGGDLYQYLRHHGALDITVARDIINQLLDALNACHARAIVHRDVKPENILLAATTSGKISVKLGDFGLATSIRHGLTRRCGSAGYMAPEMKQGNTYNSGVDIWSLGVVAYNLLTGRMPSFDALEVLQIGPEVALPEDAITCVQQMLAPLPASRPSAAELKCHPWLMKNDVDVTEILVEHLVARKDNAQDPTLTRHLVSMANTLRLDGNIRDDLLRAMTASLIDEDTVLPLLSGEGETYHHLFQR
ncbi:myosin light chain kinase [Achlya hypogyna]|uniref:Myosin light chain kinase n=1 Tax=Achlya hypogyna TaxID=1202772 RepID=A0A1V9Y9G4_ACHHY|nr:myosin light chain kinase [Achlya hypogyna]